MPHLVIPISGQVASQTCLEDNRGSSSCLVPPADHIHAPVLLNDSGRLGPAQELGIAGQGNTGQWSEDWERTVSVAWVWAAPLAHDSKNVPRALTFYLLILQQFAAVSLKHLCIHCLIQPFGSSVKRDIPDGRFYNEVSKAMSPECATLSTAGFVRATGRMPSFPWTCLSMSSSSLINFYSHLN